jgi:hypothetical protein
VAEFVRKQSPPALSRASRSVAPSAAKRSPASSCIQPARRSSGRSRLEVPEQSQLC